MSPDEAIRLVLSRLVALARRQKAIDLLGVFSLVALSFVLGSMVTQWVGIAVAVLIFAVLALWAARSGRFNSPSRGDAAQILDDAFKLKGRLLAHLGLGEGPAQAQENTEQVAQLIDRQIRERLPQFIDSQEVAPSNLSSSDRRIIAASLLSIAVLLGILFSELSPFVSRDPLVSAIHSLLRENPELPAEVKESLKQLESALAKPEPSDAEIRAALNKARDELQIANSSLAEGNTKTLEEKTLGEDSSSTKPTPNPGKPTPLPLAQASPTPSTTPDNAQASKEEKKEDKKDADKEKQDSEKKDTDVQNSKSTEGGDKGKEKEEQGKDGEKSKEDSKSQGGEGKGEKQEGQGDKGKSDSDAEKKDGKGEGQGEGGKEGKNGNDKSEGKDQGKEKGESGKDAGDKSGKEEGGKDGSSGKSSGDKGALDNAQKTLNDVEKKLNEKSSEQKKNESSKGQGGKEGKDKDQKGDAQSGDSSQNKLPPDKNDKKDGKKEGQSDSKPASDKPKAAKGNDQGADPGDSNNNDDKASKSALPRPDEKQTGESPFGKGVKPGIDGPKEFKESEINGKDEKFDASQTEKDGTKTLNPNEARPKTEIAAVKLAKPEAAKQDASQPIPLEYRDMLEE